MCTVKLPCQRISTVSGIRKLKTKFANCKQNLYIIAEYTYTCGLSCTLSNPPEFGKTETIEGIHRQIILHLHSKITLSRNPQL